MASKRQLQKCCVLVKVERELTISPVAPDKAARFDLWPLVFNDGWSLHYFLHRQNALQQLSAEHRVWGTIQKQERTTT